MTDPPRQGRSVMATFRRGVVWALAAGVLVYVAMGFYAGRKDVTGELAHFAWALMGPILGLSLANYGIRFLRWELYLRRLGIRVRPWTSVSVFLAGLAMTITPGKVGEFIKSYLLKEAHDVPMATSAPVVFVERVGDLLGLLLLASLGVATYRPDAVPLVALAVVICVAAIVILQSERLTGVVLGAGRKPA